MLDPIEIIGLVAGACTTFSAVPQIRKIIATKSAKDISYVMFAMNCTGNALWITYAFFKDSASLMLANAISLCFMATIIVLKYYLHKHGPPSKN